MFVYAPDIKTQVHPIRFGSGDWTACSGLMTGTFSKPMPVGNRKTIAPTGKHLVLGRTAGFERGALRVVVERDHRSKPPAFAAPHRDTRERL